MSKVRKLNDSNQEMPLMNKGLAVVSPTSDRAKNQFLATSHILTKVGLQSSPSSAYLAAKIGGSGQSGQKSKEFHIKEAHTSTDYFNSAHGTPRGYNKQ